ncbi:MAG: VWA domain-containing protein [Anaerolineales bacterium]|nr:VWA domain-containing protein [Anaerolineales bacterium]MCB8954353.1 VWA domain-containing protein [Ardenticatenales bacterium]
MDNRVIEFIHGLRAAGVRVSLAESQDALRAMDVLGVRSKTLFRESLRATLIKEADDFTAFNELFPLYFGSGGPPLQNALEDMSADEQEMLKAALSALSGRLQQLLDWLTGGQGPTKEELEDIARRAGAQWAQNPQEGKWITRRMLRQMGFAQLEEMMQQLMAQLQAMGMSQEAIERLTGVVQANREALAEQIAQQVGRQIGEQLAEQQDRRPDGLHGPDLMHKSFEALSAEEANLLRKEVQRLVTQLRSRAALRRKRGAQGKFDAKSTIRANQRYDGIPFELRFKKNKLKPSLVLICDVSNSMRAAVEFMLRLVYELQDQVSRARSFAFYGDLAEITGAMDASRVEKAIQDARDAIPGGPWRTDLGNSLETFFKKHLDAVDGRTTVIILGDGRNSWNAPRVDLIQDLQRRAKRLIWLNPESPRQWGTGDSDMLLYEPHCDRVYPARNLAQLSAAVDKLLVDN